jgi:hypothetical protein
MRQATGASAQQDVRPDSSMLAAAAAAAAHCLNRNAASDAACLPAEPWNNTTCMHFNRACHDPCALPTLGMLLWQTLLCCLWWQLQSVAAAASTHSALNCCRSFPALRHCCAATFSPPPGSACCPPQRCCYVAAALRSCCLCCCPCASSAIAAAATSVLLLPNPAEAQLLRLQQLLTCGGMAFLGYAWKWSTSAIVRLGL